MIHNGLRIKESSRLEKTADSYLWAVNVKCLKCIVTNPLFHDISLLDREKAQEVHIHNPQLIQRYNSDSNILAYVKTTAEYITPSI